MSSSANHKKQITSCANRYNIIEDKNGKVRMIPLRCNKNSCPFCSSVHAEEMRNRICEAQQKYGLQYMITVSPTLIGKNNAAVEYKELCKTLDKIFSEIYKLNSDYYIKRRNACKTNNSNNNKNNYEKYCDKFKEKIVQSLTAHSRYKEKSIEDFRNENKRAYKNIEKRAENLLETLTNKQFRLNYIRITELSSLRKSTKNGVAIHYHILCNADISDIIRSKINGKVMKSDVYDIESLSNYLTKMADYTTYDLWIKEFGRVQKRYTASCCDGKSIIASDNKKEDTKKDYKRIETVVCYGSAPKGEYPDINSLKSALSKNLARVDEQSEKKIEIIAEEYAVKCREECEKQINIGKNHSVQAVKSKMNEAFLTDINNGVYLPSFKALLDGLIKEETEPFKEIKKVSKSDGFSSEQEKAIRMFGEKSRLMIITGFAGSGKSYVVEKLMEYYSFTDKRVQITSNAQRIADTLCEKMKKRAENNRVNMTVRADNVCRLLHVKERGAFCSLSPTLTSYINADLLIVEEASMLSFEELYKLFYYTDKSTKIILLGDTFQISSFTSEYNILDVFTAINYKEMAGLDTCYRQSSGNRLLALAEKIRKNKDFRSELIDRSTDFDEKEIMDLYRQGCVFLCATNTECVALEKVIFGQNGFIKKGNKLMVTQNYPKYGLTNGMLCTVSNLNKNTIELEKPSGKKVRVDRGDRRLKLASAEIMTVHKSQGLEFDKVVLFIKGPDSVEMINHNMLYTAVTRAKGEFKIIFGNTDKAKLSERLYKNRRSKDISKLKTILIKENAPEL